MRVAALVTRLLLAGASLVLAAACVDDSFDDGQFLCDPSGGADECPSGLSCGTDGFCRRSPAKLDGGNGDVGADGCLPRSCAEVGNQCGEVDDGCGQLMSCGCTPPDSCGGGGITGECGCSPEQSRTRSPDVLYDDGSAGSVGWTNVDAAKIADDVWVTTGSAMASGQTTHFLKAADFKLDLPDGAEVTGVAVRVERSGESGAESLKDGEIRVLVQGLPLPAVAHKTSAWDATDTSIQYGGKLDLWEAASIAAADVERSDFGVSLSVTASGAATPRIDLIEVEVFFIDPSCPGVGG